ncbi:MAG: hypothetical protein KF800_18665 [Lysobacter sp.]|nr:hypothetical protein [Lysobacter sp.]
MQPEFIILFVLGLAPAAIVLIVLRYRYRQTQARYNAVMHLADKGVAPPVQLLIEPRAEFCERRRALVLISVGLGIIAMFTAMPMPYDNGRGIRELWGIGLLPLITGFGYLASWWLNRRDDKHG